ncbi:hypothetical protein [Streptomyces goshikiensis]
MTIEALTRSSRVVFPSDGGGLQLSGHVVEAGEGDGEAGSAGSDQVSCGKAGTDVERNGAPATAAAHQCAAAVA